MTTASAPLRADVQLQSAFAVVVGLDPGACNVGLCVWLSTAVGPDVLEAVTIELDGTGPLAISAAARLAIRTATDILADNSDRVAAAAAAAGVGVPAPLFCVENLIPPRRHTQQQRAVAQSTKVQSAVLSTGVSLGALLSALHGKHVQIVEPAGWDHRDGGPQVLRGRQPAGWRGRKGSERQHQRSAYFLSVEGLRGWLAAGNHPAPMPQRLQPPPSVTSRAKATHARGGPLEVFDAVAAAVEPASEPTRPNLPTGHGTAGADARIADRDAEHCCIEAQYGRSACGHQKRPRLSQRTRALPTSPAPRRGGAGG